MQPTRLLSIAAADAARLSQSRLTRRAAVASAFIFVAITAACGSDSRPARARPR